MGPRKEISIDVIDIAFHDVSCPPDLVIVARRDSISVDVQQGLDTHMNGPMLYNDMDEDSLMTSNSSSDDSVSTALQNILDLDAHLNNRLLKLQMVFNQIMNLSNLKQQSSFKEHMTKLFALHVYIENSLGSVNSQNFGVNKKKSF